MTTNNTSASGSGGGKKKKQKSKQRRNTQTIAMEGAQLDSSQLYQAVCSYNPILFSHSGRSTEELSLVEGDIVKPITNVDATGYLYAQVCGNKGLVPAAYLIPLNKAASAAASSSSSSAEVAFGHDHVIHRDNNKTNSNENNNNLLAASDNNKNDADVTHQSAQRNNNKDNKDNKDNRDMAASLPSIDGKYKTEECSAKNELPSAGQPHSPSKVFVQRVLSDFSILLGWVMPPMDEFGYSNGVQVKGYRIFVND